MPQHDVDAVSLVAGLLLLGVVGAWALVASGATDLSGLRVLAPVVLLVAGGAGALASLRPRRGRPGGRPPQAP